MTDINQIAITSPDGRQERLEQLRVSFPDLFDGEGRVNEKALRALISDEVGVAAERFTFEWAGKHKSKRFAFSPSKATLQFDAERSLNKDGSPNMVGATLDDNTSKNLIIEGDNLEVLKLLQATYFEQVKCIYIDPPYNTGNDFIYPDDFSESKSSYWEKNGSKKRGVKLVAVPESSGRKHSNWLNMIYPRLLAARQMLSDDGLILVSIDDNEVANLRRAMDEVFGTTNFLAQITVQSNKRGQTYKDIAKTHEYIVVYAKSDDFEIFEFQKAEGSLPFKDEKGKYDLWELRNRNPKFNSSNRPNLFFPIWVSKTEKDKDGFCRASIKKPAGDCVEALPLNSERNESVWRWGQKKVAENIDDDFPTVVARQKKDGGWNIYQKSRRDTTKAKSIWYETDVISEKGTVELGKLGLAEYFEHPKPLGLLQRVLNLTCEGNDIFLDFFAGSGTSAHGAFLHNHIENHNVRSILVQVPELTEKESNAFKGGYELISDLTIERVKRAGASIRKEHPKTTIDTGFRVFKLTDSSFPENLFSPDPAKSEEENLKSLEAHLAEAAQMRLFSEDEFSNLVTEISLKNGFGLFYELEPVDGLSNNKVYRLIGNDKSALLCLDNDLHDKTVEGLKPFKDEQLIVSRVALDTTKKFSLHTEFKDNLWVV